MNVKPIAGFEGLYSVTDCGKVISHFRGMDKALSPKNGKGYHYVHLRKENKSYMRKVSRLVAMAFIPNPNNLPEVNHKNFITNDDSVSNLEWVTAKENAAHSIRSGRPRGPRTCKTRPVIAHLFPGNYSKVYSAAKKAALDGFDPPSITNCCRGRLKTHKGFRWQYFDDFMKAA